MRELTWAANARQQSEWVRGAVLTAAVVNKNQFSAKVDPAKLVPDCYRDDGGESREKPRTAEEEAAESEIAWRLLGMGLERN